MTNKEQKRRKIGPIRKGDGTLLCDDKEKANAMNYYLATIGEKLASCLPGATQTLIAS